MPHLLLLVLYSAYLPALTNIRLPARCLMSITLLLFSVTKFLKSPLSHYPLPPSHYPLFHLYIHLYLYVFNIFFTIHFFLLPNQLLSLNLAQPSNSVFSPVSTLYVFTTFPTFFFRYLFLSSFFKNFWHPSSLLFFIPHIPSHTLFSSHHNYIPFTFSSIFHTHILFHLCSFILFPLYLFQSHFLFILLSFISISFLKFLPQILHFLHFSLLILMSPSSFLLPTVPYFP